MWNLLLLGIALELVLIATYIVERAMHRMERGSWGWTCENAQCSCRGSLDDLVVRRPMARKRYDPTGRPWGRGW